MAKNNLTKMLATGAVLAGFAVPASANLIDVTQVGDIVNLGSDYKSYNTSSLTDNGATPTQFTILWAQRADGTIVGGVQNVANDPDFNPSNASGFMNGGADGLAQGATPTQWFGGYDANGNGKVGTFDTDTLALNFEAGEYIAPAQIQVNGFAPYGTGNTITSINITPEPATLSVLALGAAGLALRRRRSAARLGVEESLESARTRGNKGPAYNPRR